MKMGETKARRPFTKAIYLEILMRQFNISLLKADNYFGKNRDKLEKMSGILVSKKETDVKKCLALLHMLSHGNSCHLILNYCPDFEESEAREALIKITDYTEKYKLELLSALFYNSNFFNDVKIWFKNIAAPAKTEKPGRKSSMLEEQITNSVSHDSMPKTDFVVIFFEIKPPIYGTPADDHELKYMDKYDVDDIYGLYSGNFEFYGNTNDQLLEVRFQFKDKETGELLNSIPCYMDIEVVSNADNIARIIHLDRPMKSKLSTIRSEAKNVNYSKGFTVKVQLTEQFV